jgi:pectate lyase
VVPALDRPPVEAALVAAPAVPAFPGAEGFGTQTPGGRGGAVLKVTNLDDSGPGSLRAALTASGPRTVVFGVSGTISLKSRIDVEDPYVTVAGQTAPGGGITLRIDPAASPCVDQGTMLISTHDVVVRYLRFRPGPTTCADDSHDALTIYKAGTENVVIDHASLSWAVDEVVNTYDASQNITISNSIIAEGLSNSTHPDGEHSKGALLGGVDAHNVSLHGNLFVSNVDRNPQISGISVADVRNNVIYNYGAGSGSGVTLVSSSKGEPRVNWVGNYYKPGPSSDPNRPEFAVHSGSTGDTWQWYGEANMRWTPNGLVSARVHSGATASRRTSPFAAAPVTTTSAAAAYDLVLAHAGAAVPFRDAVDRRLVQSVLDGTGQLIDSPNQVGGYPTLPSAPAAPDDDGDGMPNSAEVAYGTNPNVADSTGDLDQNGYTNIEDWFNGLTPAPTPPPPPAPTPVTYTAEVEVVKKAWRKKDKVARLRASIDITYHCSACWEPRRRLKIQALRSGRWTTIATHRYRHPVLLSVPVSYTFTKVRVKVPAVKKDAYTTYAGARSNTIKVPHKPKG